MAVEIWDKQGFYHFTQDIQRLYKNTEKFHMNHQEIKGMRIQETQNMIHKNPFFASATLSFCMQHTAQTGGESMEFPGNKTVWFFIFNSGSMIVLILMLQPGVLQNGCHSKGC